jgi:hypothetical protein
MINLFYSNIGVSIYTDASNVKLVHNLDCKTWCSNNKLEC